MKRIFHSSALPNQVGIKSGYRILEGEADKDEVDNYAPLHFLSVGVYPIRYEITKEKRSINYE